MITKLAILTGIDQTVIYPIVNKVTNDLKTKILKDEKVFINMVDMYSDENQTMPDNIYNNDTGISKLDVKLSIEQNEELDIVNDVYKPVNKILFLDMDNSFSIRPLYVATDVVIAYTYKAYSKTSLLNVQNRLKTLYRNSSYSMGHELPYSFILPSNVLSLIKDITLLKNGDTDIITYLNSIARVKYDITTLRDNSIKTPVFRGIQSNVIGTFDNKPEDDSIDKSTATEYELSFKYTITIQKPLSLALQYPILINNKKLPDKWLGTNTIAKPILTQNGELDVKSILGILINNKTPNSPEYLYRVPDYDKFVPRPNTTDTTRITLMSILIEIDETDPTLVLNIDDLKYIGLPSYIVSYLKNTTGNNIFSFGESLFHIELYDKDNIKDLGLYKDVNNIIYTTEPLKLSTTYHIVINIVIDVNYINYIKDDIRIDSDRALLEYLDINYIKDTGNNKYIAPKVF